MATISAWAVGSLSRMVRLPERARILPSWTIVAPIGTSPAVAAARASASASCMNWISESIFGERITRGKRRFGINTESTESTEFTEKGEIGAERQKGLSKQEEGVRDIEVAVTPPAALPSN